MKRVILGIILLAGVAVGQTAPTTLDSTGAISLACPPGGCQPVTISQGSWSLAGSARSAPSNEVVMQALEYGKTYSGKAVDVQILPRDKEAGGILLAVTAKVAADWAIIEVLYRQPMQTWSGRKMRLFRTERQVFSMGDFGPGVACLSDPIPLKLEDVEKINVRLVTESSVVEFWSDTSEIKHPVK